VRELAAERGEPQAVHLWEDGLRADYSWSWVRDGKQWAAQLTRDGATITARFGVEWADNFRRPTITATEARRRLNDMREQLSTVRFDDNERGAAIRCWSATIQRELASLERFLDLLARTTPTASVSEHVFARLRAPITYLVENEARFRREDDWKDALVVDPRDSQLAWSWLGWTYDSATEGDSVIQLVRGPFAAGVFRERGAREVYAVGAAPHPSEVELTPLMRAPLSRPHKLLPDEVLATLGGRTARLSGFDPDLSIIARLLMLHRQC
jgi:hypothetical protein